MKKRIHKKFGIFVLLSAIFLVTIHCEREKIVPREYPRIDISDHIQQSSEGVLFKGSILSTGNSEILKRGFVWSNKSNPNLKMSRIFADPGGSSDEFSGTAKTDLFQNTTYYVKAFVQTSDYIVYSREISFDSEYEKPVHQLNSFYPKSTMWGDTVIIRGDFFSYLSSQTEVWFGESNAMVLSCSGTTIQVLVPPVEDTPSISISVKIYEESVSFEEKFNFLYPQVLDYFPKEATFNDTITIVSSGLPENPVWLEVAFGEHQARVISYADQEFKVLVPEIIESVTSLVNTRLYGLSSTFDEVFTLKPPMIYSFDPAILVMPDDTLFIQGANFNALEGYTSVKLGGNICEMLYSSRDKLGIRVPRSIINDPLIDQSEAISVVVEVAGQTTDPISIPLQYKNKWTRKEDFPGLKRYKALTYGYEGKGYYGLGMAHDSYSHTDFWEYDPMSDTWTRLPDFPSAGPGYMTAFGIDDKIYVCGGTRSKIRRENDCLDDVWEYSISQNSWTQLADFPGFPRHSASAFTIGGKAYLIGGNYGSNELNDVWEYDPDGDTWTQKSNMPDIPTSYPMDICVFQDSEYGFALGTDNSSTIREFWRYNPQSDSWLQLEDLAGLTQAATGFLLNGCIYAGSFWDGEVNHYDFFCYTISENAWIPYLQPTSERIYPDAMVIDGNGYILGGGGTGYGEPLSLWEFDPN